MIKYIIFYALTALAAYLLGSLNFGIIVSKLFYKTDVRTVGSGNAGMTNVLRTFGKGAAAAVLAGDLLKGVVAVLIGKFAAGQAEELKYCPIVAALFVVIGHVFPVFFGFKGGKGVATSFAVILMLEPVAVVAIMFAVFLVCVFASKTISLGSLVSFALCPIITFLYLQLTGAQMVTAYVIATALIAALVIFMHRSNIKRLINGEENKLNY